MDDHLTGLLSAKSGALGDFHPKATVDFVVVIDGTGIHSTISRALPFVPVNGGLITDPINLEDVQKGFVPDGTDTVRGFLDTTARTDKGFGIGVSASSQFFDPGLVIVSASAVPEPSAITLAMIGASGLLAWKKACGMQGRSWCEPSFRTARKRVWVLFSRTKTAAEFSGSGTPGIAASRGLDPLQKSGTSERG